MNFWQIFQLFEKPERERGGDSAARRLFRALSGSAGLRRPRRAIGASASLRLESLEVRQVLSSISPVPQDLNSRELPGSPVESDAAEMSDSGMWDSGMSDVARVVNSFRGQLSAAIVSFQPVQTSKVAEVSGDQAMSLATVSDGVPQLTATVGPSDVVTAQAPINVRVVLDWGKSDRQVTVVGWSGDVIAVTVLGLGNNSLAPLDAAVAEDLILSNTTEIFGILLPYRTLEFSFQRPPAVKDSSFRFDDAAPDPSSRMTNTGRDAATEKPARLPSEITSNRSGNIRAVLPEASFVPDELTDPVRLIDEVFLDGSLIVGDAGLTSVSKLWLSADEQTENVAELNRSASDVRLQGVRTHAALDVNGPLQARSEFTRGLTLPGVVPGLVRRGWNLLKSGKWIIGDTATRRSFADAERAPLPGNEPRAGQSAEMTEDLGQVLDWLTWIMNPADERPSSGAGYRSPASTETRPSPVPAKQGSVSRDVQTNSWNEHSQTRRQRDSLRHLAAWGGSCSVFYDELEMVPLPVLGSFPAELRYECQPRGPPVYGRDVDTPSAKMDAPESVLERLRYSIAPRGPSLVTVEMQSPDFEFSSGPRVSPEELRHLAV